MKLDDRQLMERACQENDNTAFGMLVTKYKDRLYNFIYRMIPEDQEAQDLLQETFLRAYKKRNSYSPDFAFSTWLYTIATNLVRSEYRKRKRWKFISIGIGSHDDELSIPEYSGKDLNLMPFIDKALKNIGYEYRAAFILRDIQQLPYDQIAEILKIPVGTVKSRLNRARGLLREQLLPLRESYNGLSKGIPQSLGVFA
ncbi:MAG: sigma-70 family RNA polymerase sigma factor [candidate division Zixibacteria bacterium]|nr:sigma-70 family RNA polymerase sigma factor [candidate division Zixibacteria bacterium]